MNPIESLCMFPFMFIGGALYCIVSVVAALATMCSLLYIADKIRVHIFRLPSKYNNK